MVYDVVGLIDENWPPSGLDPRGLRRSVRGVFHDASGGRVGFRAHRERVACGFGAGEALPVHLPSDLALQAGVQLVAPARQRWDGARARLRCGYRFSLKARRIFSFGLRNIAYTLSVFAVARIATWVSNPAGCRLTLSRPKVVAFR